MKYSIEFRPSVLKALKQFTRREQVRLKKKIEELSTSLPNQSVTKLRGNNPFHKVRSGNYRIIYEIHGDKLVIFIVKVRHRKNVYKNPD